MDLYKERAALKSLLTNCIFRFDGIKLSSGKTSRYYVDVRAVTTLPEGAKLAAKIMGKMIGPVDAVGGPILGAVPILGALAALENYRTFIVRKEPKKHGLGKWIEGCLGKKVAIIDDVATTGRSLIRAIQIINDLSPWTEITKVVVLVDRQEGAQKKLAKHGYQLMSVFQMDELLKVKTFSLEERSK